MRTPYSELVGLESIYLEDSWVVGICIDPTEVTFDLEVVLTETHEEYEPPPPDSQYCYRRGKLRFTNVAQVAWSNRGRLPATDATGEQDFGNIDQFYFEGSYFLEGDWGRMTILADNAPTIEWIDTTP